MINTNMDKMNSLKLLIPLAAVVVIIESVVVMSGVSTQNSKKVAVAITPVPVVTQTKTVESAQAGLVFEVDSKTMKVGTKYPVGLVLSTKKNLQIDTFDLYIKYDPSAFEISDLSFDKKVGKPVFSKISKDKGLVVVNIYMSDVKGLEVISGVDLVKLVGFNAKPLKMGNYSFEVNAGNGGAESATMMVENGTAKVIPFSSSKLDVAVSK